MSGAAHTPRLRYLTECGSTNLYAKQHAQEFLPMGVVYTDSQTAGRGRLGRAWANAAGQGLYYTIVFGSSPAQPETLPQLASLAAARALREQFGADCRIKWPNDLLLNGKKLVGILCESTETPQGRVWVCGMGTNLAQPQSYFDENSLPYGTSLALQGIELQLPQDMHRLAAAYTELFAGMWEAFAQQGFAPLRQAYRDACVNIGHKVIYPLPGGGTAEGMAEDIDENGRLVVRTAEGTAAVFTGEVSVKGIYGTL